MISKCDTVVLSKIKFSEFENLPADADLDNVFLAGYSFDENGEAYNVKVNAGLLKTNTLAASVNNGYKSYAEIEAPKDIETDTLKVSISEAISAGTIVKLLVKNIPANVKTLEFLDTDNISHTVCTYYSDNNWNCFFEVLKSSDSYIVLNVNKYL